jgi:hypothetical protein
MTTTKKRIYGVFGAMTAIGGIAVAFAGAFAPPPDAQASAGSQTYQYPAAAYPSYNYQYQPTYQSYAGAGQSVPPAPQAPYNVSPVTNSNAYAPYYYAPYGQQQYGYGQTYAAHPLQLGPSAPAPYYGGVVSDPSSVPIVSEHGQTFNAGFPITFTGSGFGAHEQVVAYQGGVYIGSGTTDAGGHFSVGLRTSPMPGFYSYTFAGQTTGRSASATVLTED